MLKEGSTISRYQKLNPDFVRFRANRLKAMRMALSVADAWDAAA